MASFAEELVRQQAALPRYRNFFLSYPQLQREVRALRERGDRHAAEAELTEHLRTELNRVNDIVVVQWEVLLNQLKVLLRKEEGAPVDLATLENLANEALLLQDFVQTNFAGFREIMRECDEQCGTSLSVHFMPSVESAPFRRWDFNVILAQLGQLYQRLRLQQGASRPGPAPPTGAFVQTYLVPPGSALRVKVGLVKHLSPSKESAERPDEKHAATVREWNRLLHSAVPESFSQPLHHVYFDNDKGQQYAERLRRLSGAADAASRAPVFQCQWEGENTGKKGFELHFDVESAGGARVDVHLRQSDVRALLEGKLDTSLPGRSVMADVQAAIVNDGLRPSVSASFLRSSFVGSEGPARGAVVTLDEEVAFFDEAAPHGTTGWCRASQEAKPLHPSEAEARLPEGVLRIWAPSRDSLGAMLDHIEGLGVRCAPGFSKAVQGEVLLHPKLASPPPPWLRAEGESPQVAVSRQPPAALVTAALESPPERRPQAAITTRRTIGLAAAPVAATSFLRGCWEAAAGSSADLKVDLKTPLAIQRTVLRWLRTAVILASLSAYLSSASDLASQLHGLLLGVAALVFVAWPTAKFWQNSLGLTKAISKQPKVDRTLPQVLAGTLTVVLFLVLAVDYLSRTA